MSTSARTETGVTDSSSEADPLIRVANIRVAYSTADRGEVVLVSDLSFDVRAGQFVCLAGRSGSGKTSILRQVCGITPAARGTVFWEGKDVRSLSQDQLADGRRTQIAYLDQSAGLIEELSCLDNVVLPAIPDGKRRVRRATRQAILRLGELGLGAHLNARPGTLSGGERQRAVLARVLTSGAAGIVADEPTASLDRAWADTVIATLRAHAAGGGAVLAASHDPALAEAADRVIHLE